MYKQKRTSSVNAKIKHHSHFASISQTRTLLLQGINNNNNYYYYYLKKKKKKTPSWNPNPTS